ncbi:MAG: glycosyltransferase family 2 protein [Clostridia bacterium]|nr:glycosyltransferase family 2 protein [Clostridia bacterium]
MRDLIARAKLTPPYISVVIPVYNVEEYLRRTLDSVVYQTLQEIEIIVVNDCTPDRSQDIIDEYAQRYPNMIVPLKHETNQGLALARQTGYKHARAPYVMFLDSDDFFDSRACELALTEMLRGNHDLVGMKATHWDDDGNNLPWVVAPTDLSKHSLVRSAPAAFWNYLYARELLEGEDIFIPMYFEDAGVTPRILAKARSIGWLTKGFHIFYAARSGSIMNTFANSRKRSDYFKADAILWQHAAGPYQADFAWRLGKRMSRALIKFPELYTDCVTNIQQLYPQLKPHLPKDFPQTLRDKMEFALTLPDHPLIPTILYADGFHAAQRGLEDYIREIRSFPLAQQVIVLDESNCDLAAAPAHIREAAANGQFAEAAVWFAVKGIQQTGGLYFAPGAHPLAALETLRYNRVLLCAGDKQTASLHFFGGAAGEAWWQRLLDVLAQPGGTAEERATMLLLTEGGVHLLGDKEEGIDGLYIPARAVTELRASECACYLDYSGLPAPEGCCVIPEGTYRQLVLQGKEGDEVLQLRKQVEALRKECDQHAREKLRYYGLTPRGFLGRVKRKVLRMLKKQ